MDNYNQNKIKLLTECIEKLEVVIEAELANSNFAAVAELKAMIRRWETDIQKAKKEM